MIVSIKEPQKMYLHKVQFMDIFVSQENGGQEISSISLTQQEELFTEGKSNLLKRNWKIVNIKNKNKC